MFILSIVFLLIIFITIFINSETQQFDFATQVNISAFALDINTGSCVGTSPPENKLNPNNGTCTTNDITTDASLDSSDDSSYSIYGNSANEFGWILINVNTTGLSNINKINWTIEADNNDGFNNPNGIINFYIWNNTNSSWFKLGSIDSITDVTLSLTVNSSIEDYINDTNYINLLVHMNSEGLSAKASVDYTNIILTYSFSDVTLPEITIITPSNNTSHNNVNLSINYSYIEVNPESCWWTNDSGLNNYSISCNENITNQTWGEGNTVIIIYMNDTSNNIGNNTVTFNIDTVYPNITINSINTTIGLQTISFNSTEQDINNITCKYTIYNSSGDIDGTNENVSYTCGDGLSHSATTFTFGNFNLTIYAKDLAGNENVTSKNLTTEDSPPITIPPGSGSGGGTGDITIIIQNLTWSMQTEQDSDFYELQMTAFRGRTRDLILKNNGPTEINISLFCQGDLCDSIELERSNITLSVGNEQETRIKVYVNIPTNTPKGTYVNNIIAADQFEGQQLVTIITNVGGGFSFFGDFTDKMFGFLKFNNIIIPYALIFTFIWVFITFTSFFIVLNKVPGGKIFSGFFGLIIGILLITFL